MNYKLFLAETGVLFTLKENKSRMLNLLSSQNILLIRQETQLNSQNLNIQKVFSNINVSLAKLYKSFETMEKFLCYLQIKLSRKFLK